MVILPESSFFKERRGALPMPAEIRAINKKLGHYLTPPVMIPSLGLVVKYRRVTPAETQTQLMIYEKLQGQVPVPEIFGWAEDGGLFTCF
jgi:hypothetical protein